MSAIFGVKMLIYALHVVVLVVLATLELPPLLLVALGISSAGAFVAYGLSDSAAIQTFKERK
jgi:hypothetical protein